MSLNLNDFFKYEIRDSIFLTPGLRKEFWERIARGNLAEKENQESHVIVYFAPYNPLSKKVFMVFDLKTSLWLFPGGHMHVNENSRDSLVREVNEELRFVLTEERITKPFLVTKTRSTQVARGCVWHWDIWYRVDTDGGEFNLSQEEFREYKWVSIEDAKKFVTEPNTLIALGRIGYK